MKPTILIPAFVLTAVIAVGIWYTHENYWGEDARRSKQLEIEREILLDRVRSELKDPLSAQFKIYVQWPNYLCGEVNAKNSYGAYDGFKYFILDGRRVDFKPDAYAKFVGSAYTCPQVRPQASP